MKRISVLGAGLVGGLIARDLASEPDFEVTSYDASEAALSTVETIGSV